MNDAAGSVFIEDPSGNCVFLDGQGNIKVDAPKRLILNSTDIEINAYNNLEINVGNNMIMNVMTKLFVFTPQLQQIVSGFMNLFSGKALINSNDTINIEAQEVTTHGTKKMLVHSDKLTTINSMEIAEMHGATKNNFTNKPISQKKKATDKITNTMVEFRTKQDGSYRGQFGFDWLRIDDNFATAEKKYEDCLENGYEAPNGKAPNRDSNTEFETGEAFSELEKMYKQIPVKRASTPTLTKYYIPYLNLYPEAINVASTSTPKPPCEAELRVLVDVEIEEPDQIRIIFNKDYFNIDGKDGTDANPVLITSKAIGTKRDTGSNITIKCIKEFSGRKEITVYAYPKDSLTKSAAQQLILRKVAGRIFVEPNKNTPASKGKPAVKNRKTQKFVFVQVRTNLTGTIEIGAFNKPAALDEKDNLQNALHQALIHGEFEDGPILDLTLEPDFISGGKYDAGGTFNEDYRKVIGGTATAPVYDKIPHFFRDMKKIFLSRPGNAKYNNYFTVFVIEDPVYDDAKGQIEGEEYVEGGIKKMKFFKNLILFKNRDTCTMNHEGLHGLGLFHTHADGTIYSSNQKFVFVHSDVDITKSTDNVMCYRNIAYTTWQWQWVILTKKVN